MWKRLSLFWNEGLFNFSLSREVRWKQKVYKWLRIFVLSIKRFHTDRCVIRASALTYYTLMSIVPILALFFAVASGLGLQEYLREELLKRFQDQSTAFTEIIRFAERLLEETRGGIIAIVGFGVLFWSSIRLLEGIEDSLNHIWEVGKMRTFRKLLSEYISILIAAPIFFILSTSAVLLVSKYLNTWVHLLPINQTVVNIFLFIIHLLPYCLFWLFFSSLYYVLPNTKVRFSSAFAGGVIAGTLYLFVQWGYVFFQVGVSRYGAIYGSFAALPLFLIWLQLSWFLLLFGAELSYSHQTLNDHEYEPLIEKISPKLKKVTSLWVYSQLFERFQKEKEPTSLNWLIETKEIPPGLLKLILEELTGSDLLEKKGTNYFPKKRATVLTVLQAIEEKGVNEFPFLEKEEINRFEKVFDELNQYLEKSDANKLI
jgi:membrane protein